jgi:cytidylate kinase
MRSNTMEILNRQILKWEKRRQESDKQTSPAKTQKPMITISSAYGSQGWNVGKIVGEVLGFDVYDREIVERIAASANVRDKMAESLDERVQDWISEYISHQFENYSFTSSDFLRHLSKVVLAIGLHGEAVIIGRGSQFILKPETTLRVRTTAPLEVRIRCISEIENLSEKDTRAVVLHKDAERAAFCRLHFNKDITDPNHYDLMLNTSTMTLKQHADIITYTFLSRFGQSAHAR